MNNSFSSVRGFRPLLLSLGICVTIYAVDSHAAFTSSVPFAARPAQPMPPNAGLIPNTLRQTQPEVYKSLKAAPVELSAIGNEQNQLNDGTPSARLTLKAVKVESGLFTPGSEEMAELQMQLKSWLGRSLLFSELQAMTAQITGFFRAKGYVAARAYLPPQTLQSGALTVKVLPGMLDKPVVTNTSGFSSSFATTIIENNTCSAGAANCAQSPAEMARLERTALLLNEMPGVEGKLSLGPGTQSGTTRIHADLIVPHRFSTVTTGIFAFINRLLRCPELMSHYTCRLDANPIILVYINDGKFAGLSSVCLSVILLLTKAPSF